MLTASHRHLESYLQNTLNLRTGVDVGIVGFVIVLVFLSKIHTARQFADHHKVGTTQQFFFQGRLVQQTVERGHRTHIGKQSELLTHGQQTRLRTNLQRGIVVVLQVTHSSKQHGVGLHTHLVGAVGIRIAHLLDGMGATDGLLVFKLVSTLLSHSIKHGHTLFHNLRSDTIARENRNFQFHTQIISICSFSKMFSILNVALMAASVWSASRPRVRSILPLSFHVMTVCTRASVRPPGGMVTA